nr:MAG: hypothetical protein [Porcellio scaber clopovirus]
METNQNHSKLLSDLKEHFTPDIENFKKQNVIKELKLKNVLEKLEKDSKRNKQLHNNEIFYLQILDKKTSNIIEENKIFYQELKESHKRIEEKLEKILNEQIKRGEGKLKRKREEEGL